MPPWSASKAWPAIRWATNQWHPIVAGKFLPPGASIRTGDDGVVDVVLGKAMELPQAKWVPEPHFAGR